MEEEPSGTMAIYEPVTDEEKRKLDALHLRKIDLADEVLIINPGGYLGESTRAEWRYALERGKSIRSLEPLGAPATT